MRSSLRVVGWLLLVVGIGVGAGCSKPVLRDKPPPDPLLTSKKPIEGKLSGPAGHTVPAEDYAPPPRPAVDDDLRPNGGGRR